MPPPSTSTKPRVELGELRRTQTMPSAIAHLQGSDPFSSPWRCWAVLCCEGSPPGPPVIPPARQALKRSKPSLAGPSHARYPTTMMIMRSVRCGGENERRGGRHKKTNILECTGMSKCQNKMKSETMMLLLHHLKRKPFNLLPTWRNSLSSGDFLRFFAGDNSYKSCQNQRENSHFPVISFTPPQSATFEFIWLTTIKSHRSKSPYFQIHSVNVDAKEKKNKKQKENNLFISREKRIKHKL